MPSDPKGIEIGNGSYDKNEEIEGVPNGTDFRSASPGRIFDGNESYVIVIHEHGQGKGGGEGEAIGNNRKKSKHLFATEQTKARVQIRDMGFG